MFNRHRRRKRAMAAGCDGCTDFSLQQPMGPACHCRVLADIGTGCRCRIRRHRSQGAIRQRLLDLGFVPNAEVEVVRCATLGDPLQMRLGDYSVTLRKREADLIEVQEG
ncbi:FeoA family protein [Desulfatitalea alkaliphila]|uniref:Ferrous iron transport protein A n=1 Tax=Desulfatitalea alkaliphila TaxID=2929485 RepID=A0AA41QZ71_9BACT|nr:ferrous iron transport protein A [Desulfatitalea alkaliphila]MCJ8499787.1 ferrous iron transport protein A [Desulfatitalea alkaliphila]